MDEPISAETSPFNGTTTTTTRLNSTEDIFPNKNHYSELSTSCHGNTNNGESILLLEQYSLHNNMLDKNRLTFINEHVEQLVKQWNDFNWTQLENFVQQLIDSNSLTEFQQQLLRKFLTLPDPTATFKKLNRMIFDMTEMLNNQDRPSTSIPSSTTTMTTTNPSTIIKNSNKSFPNVNNSNNCTDPSTSDNRGNVVYSFMGEKDNGTNSGLYDVTFPFVDLVDEVSGKRMGSEDIARDTKNILISNNIGQRVFAKYVLGLSQGTVSELLSKAKPWDRLTEKQRVSYYRMHAFSRSNVAIERLKNLKPKYPVETKPSNETKFDTSTDYYGTNHQHHQQNIHHHNQQNDQVNENYLTNENEEQKENDYNFHQNGMSNGMTNALNTNPLNTNLLLANKLLNYSSSATTPTTTTTITINNSGSNVTSTGQMLTSSNSSPTSSTSPSPVNSTSNNSTTNNAHQKILYQIISNLLYSFQNQNNQNNQNEEIMKNLPVKEDVEAQMRRMNSINTKTNNNNNNNNNHNNNNNNSNLVKDEPQDYELFNEMKQGKHKILSNPSSSIASSTNAFNDITVTNNNNNNNNNDNSASIKKRCIQNLLLNNPNKSEQFYDNLSTTNNNNNNNNNIITMNQSYSSTINRPSFTGGGSGVSCVSHKNQQSQYNLLVPPIDDELTKKYSDINTSELASEIRNILNRHSITQKVFGENILGLSQGSVSDLLARPKGWSQLTTKGKEPFIRMKLFLDNIDLYLPQLSHQTQTNNNQQQQQQQQQAQNTTSSNTFSNNSLEILRQKSFNNNKKLPSSNSSISNHMIGENKSLNNFQFPELSSTFSPTTATNVLTSHLLNQSSLLKSTDIINNNNSVINNNNNNNNSINNNNNIIGNNDDDTEDLLMHEICSNEMKKESFILPSSLTTPSSTTTTNDDAIFQMIYEKNSRFIVMNITTNNFYINISELTKEVNELLMNNSISIPLFGSVVLGVNSETSDSLLNAIPQVRENGSDHVDHQLQWLHLTKLAKEAYLKMIVWQTMDMNIQLVKNWNRNEKMIQLFGKPTDELIECFRNAVQPSMKSLSSPSSNASSSPTSASEIDGESTINAENMMLDMRMKYRCLINRLIANNNRYRSNNDQKATLASIFTQSNYLTSIDPSSNSITTTTTTISSSINNNTSLFSSINQTPTITSSSSTVTSTTKRRVHFLPHQATALQEMFKRNPRPSAETMHKLASELNLNSKTIQIWFHNHRSRSAKNIPTASETPSSSSIISTISNNDLFATGTSNGPTATASTTFSSTALNFELDNVSRIRNLCSYLEVLKNSSNRTSTSSSPNYAQIKRDLQANNEDISLNPSDDNSDGGGAGSYCSTGHDVDVNNENNNDMNDNRSYSNTSVLYDQEMENNNYDHHFTTVPDNDQLNDDEDDGIDGIDEMDDEKNENTMNIENENNFNFSDYHQSPTAEPEKQLPFSFLSNSTNLSQNPTTNDTLTNYMNYTSTDNTVGGNNKRKPVNPRKILNGIPNNT
ncbi:hypothetical protein SNEBB_011432 [Seison nebaliae]|nr:hypothetical protein SNEBB_011432 [Seison nebaliae]